MSECIALGQPGNPNATRFVGPDDTYSYYIGTAQPGNPSAPHNLCLHQGYNVSPDGTQMEDTDPAWFDSWEGNYDAGGGTRWMERHIQMVSGLSTRRPFSVACKRNDFSTIVQFSGQVSWLTEDQTGQRMVLQQAPAANPTALTLGAAGVYVQLNFDVNNVPMITCRNAAGDAYANCIQLDASDMVLVGGTSVAGVKLRAGGTTRIEVNATGIGFFATAPVAQPADVVALTDNVGGANSRTLAAIPDPTDSPASADALRDDIVTNVLPKIRDAVSSMADFQNDIRTLLRSLGLMA